MNSKKISLSLSTILCITSLNAYEMKPMGFKATGMGGAGVASSRGSMATYYNPALIGISDYTAEVSLNMGVGIRENRLIDTVDQLNNLELSDTVDRIGTNVPNSDTNTQEDRDNIYEAQELLNKIPAGNGLQLTPSLSLTGQFSQYFALGIYATTEIRANMNIDKNRLNIIVKDEDTGSYFSYDPETDVYSISTEGSYQSASLQYALEGEADVEGDSTTYLNVSALSLVEVPLSFAYPIQTKSGILSFGLTAKAINAETFYTNLDIDTDTSDIADTYDQNKKTYSAIGVDIGMAYKESNTGLTIAFVGKNINKPTFETSSDVTGDSSKFELEPFFRGGLSLPVWNDNFEFAIDADLQQSDTTYEGMKSQYVGGGVEFHPASWFALRGGMMKNVATESIDEGFVYTAGLGFGLKWLQLDLSAQISQKHGTYDDQEIPKYANANLSLVSRWGDGYNKKQPILIETNDSIIENKDTISDDEKIRIENDSLKAQEELDRSL